MIKGNYAPKGKVVVVKRSFGEGNSLLKNIANEAKMLESICHPNITKFIVVCLKPVDYECFDFSSFGLNHQISDLLELDKMLGPTHRGRN